MPRRRWALLAVFIAWTTYVWVSRIVNAWGSSTESTGDKVFSTVLSGVLLALAAGGVVVLVRTWKAPLTVGAARVLEVLCGVTVVVWVVRAGQIAVSDREIGFKVVHVVLGLVSIALAVAVWRVARPVARRRSGVPAASDGGERPLAGAGDGGRR